MTEQELVGIEKRIERLRIHAGINNSDAVMLLAEVRRLRAALIEIAKCSGDSTAWVIADEALRENN